MEIIVNKILFDAICQSPPVRELLEGYPTASYPVALNGIPPTAQGLIGGAIGTKLNQTAIFVTPGEGEAEKIADCLRGLFSEEAVGFLPAQDLVFDAVDAAAADTSFARLKVLDRALAGKYRAVVTTVDGLCSLCPPPSAVRDGKLVLHPGDTLEIGDLIHFLEQSGYTRLDMVEGAGGYAVRGSIVDVFPPDSTDPVRIDFFDNEIDQIGYFDVQSQRKISQPDSVTLGIADAGSVGNREVLLKKMRDAAAKCKDSETRLAFHKDIERLENNQPISGFDRYLPLCYDKPYTLLDYLPEALLFVCDYSGMRERFSFLDWQFEEDAKRMLEARLPFFPKEKYYLTFADFNIQVMARRAVFLSGIMLSGYQDKLSYLEDLAVREDALTRADTASMISEIQDALHAGDTVLWCVSSANRRELCVKLLADNGIGFSDTVQKGIVTLLGLPLSQDWAIPAAKLLIIGENVQKKTVRRRSNQPKGEKIRFFSDITPGDLVVHVHHGIGVYRGIRQVDNHGVVKDYLTISYDGGDTLYVPTTQLDLISKYVGTAEDNKIKLSRLGTGAWEKTKQKAKTQASVLAKELIELYARRQRAEGFAFSPDTDWQRQFEDNFPYTETEDQMQCITDIKKDMEQPIPMDRLLCGDVGFGKTEVALRAVFKAVCDSKQAAILAPTTILSEQHLKTIKERFRGFPVRAEVLNRFKTKGEQDKILRRLRRGEIDIIVGTHRILQKDVVFKDLGLLVVDEEQRFGVKHKEAIKQMSVGVDVLTLSATPIPRTLNMALSGIRDMSIIEEAPANRYPVSTYVLEYDQAVVMGAIRREMRRHGCVYYLKNDIESLDYIATRISEEIPTARIAVAHGRMSGTELEKIWQSVMEREVDVLICTTIIETGIDMPFTNTLIIEDADRMGLAQLHQIRGRIGRSNVRAYAYLTYRLGRIPSEVASKRLMTIREFTAFGSGFKIAMRDLEIRGAGSILGERQHGHINTIGYDLYMKILSEAIADEKGQPETKKTDCTMDVAVSAYLPADYVSHEESRVELYKKIAGIECDEDMTDVLDELCDRFGEPPKVTVDLMRIAKLRGTARKCGVDEIKQKGERVLIYFSSGDPERMIQAISEFKGRLLLSDGARPYFTLRLQQNEDTIGALQSLIDFLSKPTDSPKSA